MPKKKRLSLLRIILEILILYLFAGVMFSLGPFTGIVYLVAITFALFRGLLFTRKNISWMIIFGTFLGFIAGALILLTIGNALAGDIVGAIVVLLIAIWIWKKGRYYRRGKRK